MKKVPLKLPDSPGVYFFKKRGEILYIGKATSLRSRVRSYFSPDVIRTRGHAIVRMVEDASGVDYKKTDSVLEALILEAALIKKHKPYYNVREKDDKSFNFVVVTDEEYPRVFTMRGKEILFHDSDLLATRNLKLKTVFGPFPHGGELREALRIIRRIFPFRDKCEPGKGKPCFNAQIGLCPGVCDASMSRTEYLRYIQNIRLFFEGKKTKIVRDFKREMKKAAKVREFEKAATYRNKIFALEHLNDIALLKRKNGTSGITPDLESSLKGSRIEAYDIAHLGGSSGVGAMTVVLDGEVAKSGYRRFKLRGVYADKVHDLANLEEVLRRRLRHTEWERPDLIVVDGALPQRKRAEKVLIEAGWQIPVVAVTKDERHKPKNIIGDSKIVRDYHHDILLANSEAHRFAITYHRAVRGKIV